MRLGTWCNIIILPKIKNQLMRAFFIILSLVLTNTVFSQDYFLNDRGPFDSSIVSPESYLGYPIGFQHTRHDRIVDYLKELARISEHTEYIEYGNSGGNESGRYQGV